MNYNTCSNVVGEVICQTYKEHNASLLDENNIIWKLLNNEWIGKRSVWTFDFMSCWLEDTTVSNVKSWWCGGKDADYNEIFKRTKPNSVKSALRYYAKKN